MLRIITVLIGVCLCGFSISEVNVVYAIKLVACLLGSACIVLGSLDFCRK